MSLQDLIMLNEKCEEFEQKIEDLKVYCKSWKDQCDEYYDQVKELNKELNHSTKEYEVLSDRLRERDEDNERLCKILIANGLGHLIEREE